jgi:hypothetical protein
MNCFNFLIFPFLLNKIIFKPIKRSLLQLFSEKKPKLGIHPGHHPPKLGHPPTPLPLPLQPPANHAQKHLQKPQPARIHISPPINLHKILSFLQPIYQQTTLHEQLTFVDLMELELVLVVEVLVKVGEGGAETRLGKVVGEVGELGVVQMPGGEVGF